MSDLTIKTVNGETLNLSEIVNVMPYKDGLLFALVVGENGEPAEHKITASEYYYLKGQA